MELPRRAVVSEKIEDELSIYRRALNHIAALSLVDVLLVTTAHYPDAGYLVVDVTDQDHSGSLRAVEVLDVNADSLADGNPQQDRELGQIWDAFSDDVGGTLANLDDANRDVWEPFTIPAGPDSYISYPRLDLFAIRRAAGDLLEDCP